MQPEVFVRLPHSWCGASVDGTIAAAALAEQLGFDGVSVQEHLLSSRGTSPCGHNHTGDDRDVLESLTTLAFVAGRTSRVKLLTGVLVLPYRGPIWVAKLGATVDALSGGRLVLGVGIGWPKAKTGDATQQMGAHAALAGREAALFVLGEPRWRLMNEAIEALVRLWADGPADLSGELIEFHAVDMRPLPVQRPHPPIWVGGRADAVLERAARLADGWFPSQASVETIARGGETVRRIAEAAGRPEPRIAVNLFVCVDRDETKARDVVRDGLGHRFKDDASLDASTIAGSPDAVVERMRRYVDAGCNAFDLKILPLQTEPTLDQMRLIAEDVLPNLRN
jgi:probable F420-dependent oxidoreductase